jgi:hypothetical protein
MAPPSRLVARDDPFRPGVTLLYAAYQGIASGLATADATGTVPLWATFVWTLRVACVLSAVALAASLVPSRWSASAYRWPSVATGLALLAVFGWDLVDSDHAIATPFLAAIVGAWNLLAILPSRRP